VGFVTVLATGFTAMAVASQGFPVAQLHLNDSGVWVTSQKVQAVGRFNYSAQQLDSIAYVTDMSHFDVLQENANVFVVDPDDGSVAPLNPANLTLGHTMMLGGGTGIELGGGMVGILIPDKGSFWLLPAAVVQSFDPTSQAMPAAVTDLPKNAAMAVGQDGTAYVVDPVAGIEKTVRVGSAGGDPVVTDKAMAGLVPDGTYAMTVVGSQPVLLSQKDSTIHLASGKTVGLLADDGATDATSVSLQMVSAEAGSVVYETPTALVSQPLNGSQATVTQAGSKGGVGVASPPVQLDGCTYAVWSGTGAFLRDCPGDSNDLTTTIDKITATSELRFRVNWGHILLNELTSGAVWSVADRVVKVDNWNSMMDADKGNQDTQAKEEIDESIKPDRTAENHPPQAVDDQFGARAGSSVLLPVVENDTDEDGDLLTASLVGDAPAGTQLSLVYSQSVFQMNVPATASGTLGFTYQVSDGRGGTSDAHVEVDVHPDSVNSPPAAIRATSLTVTSGHTVSYNVLSNWRDPDGDTIFLVGASCSPEDSVQALEDGSLAFQDGGISTGVKTIHIQVSDGQAVADGDITVNVLPPGNRPPDPTPDLVSGTVGSQIVIHPLDNDTDPDGDALQLTNVSSDPRCSVAADTIAGTITAVCNEAGSVYLTYTVTDGPSTNQESWIRILVLPAPDQDALPVAVPDTVLVSAGQETYVNVLDNDVNPMGYPLVVTSVDATADLPFVVSVIDHERVKITPEKEFTSPVSFDYTISNGKGYATSRVTVVPVPAPDRIMSPVAADDQVTVRVGDIATVDVLANDTQPNGIPLKLLPDLTQTPNPDSEALVFTSGNVVRVHARQNPGTYTALYKVANQTGSAEPDTGRLTIHVVGDDTGNDAPKPKQVEVRTLAGQPVAVTIPLDGIDPNGDFVSLVGIGSAPSQGLITAVSSTGFVYAPGDTTTGSDSFTYLVRDRKGLEATGQVLVGIAPASDQNEPPIAVTDTVETRPGRQVIVPVTANDFDQHGNTCCSLVADSATSDSFTATTQGNNVVITAPGQSGSYWGTYAITNGAGLQSTGIITVSVSPDVALKAPILGDDTVSLTDALMHTSVDVSVRDNDRDPDGDVSQDTVAVADPTVHVNDGIVTVPITSDLQIIDYTLTDPDNLVGHGFITVPGVDTIPPQYNPSANALQVKQGESVTVSLSDQILVRPGRTAKVTQAEKVSAWNGSAEAPSATQVTFHAPADYTGPAAILVEVTDGSSLEDDTGLTAVVTIPVTVLPSDQAHTPPVVSMGNATVTVEAGQSTPVDLAALAKDSDPAAKLSFSVAQPPNVKGITASISSVTMTVAADISVAKGTKATVTVEVTDGQSTAQAPIAVTVVGTTKPLPVAVDDQVPKASQGVATCVNVTANDVNPFPGSSLTVVGAVVESGQGTVSTGCNGNGVSVTPADSFLGQMVVRYTIQDQTADPDRQAQGRIYLTVRGRPAAPSGISVVQIGDQQATLKWTPPDNHGAAITGYTVTGVPGYTKQCSGTTCVLNGLTNDTTYTFTVTATNEVGVSDPSLPSQEVRPDAVPDPMKTPGINWGDQSVSLSWLAGNSHGSPITSYNLRISPAPPSGQQMVTGVTGLSYSWTGLKNGTAYKVQVCAVNSAPNVCTDPSQWSPYSVEQTPAGPPATPSAPTWTRLDPVGNQGRAQVCWSVPSDNGAAISTYTLTSSTGNVYTVSATGGTQVCQTTTLPTSQTEYTFTVSATNKAGTGAVSAQSAGFRSIVPPGTVSGLTSADKNGGCALSFSAAPLNGAKASEVSYQWQASDGTSGSFGGSTSGTAALKNSSTGYTIQVWAVTTVQSTSQKGPTTSVGNCRPYGPPNQPGAKAAQNGNAVTVSWSMPAENGRAISKLEVNIDNGGWTAVAASNGSQSVGSTCAQSHSIQVRAVDSAGQTSSVASASATAAACPKPPSCTYHISGPTNMSVTFSNMPADATQWWKYNTSGCDSNTGTPPGCWVHAGSGTYALVGWETGVNLQTHSVSIWFAHGDASSPKIVDCTRA